MNNTFGPKTIPQDKWLIHRSYGEDSEKTLGLLMCLLHLNIIQNGKKIVIRTRIKFAKNELCVWRNE